MLVCGECGTDLAVYYMAAHLQTQNVKSAWSRPLPQTLPLLAPREYRVAFPWTAIAIEFPT